MAVRTTCGVSSGPPKAENMRTTAKSFQSGWKFLTRTMMTELK